MIARVLRWTLWCINVLLIVLTALVYLGMASSELSAQLWLYHSGVGVCISAYLLWAAHRWQTQWPRTQLTKEDIALVSAIATTVLLQSLLLPLWTKLRPTFERLPPNTWTNWFNRRPSSTLGSIASLQ